MRRSIFDEGMENESRILIVVHGDDGEDDDDHR